MSGLELLFGGLLGGAAASAPLDLVAAGAGTAAATGAAASGIGSTIGLLGTGLSAIGTLAGGAAAKSSADSQAAQMEDQAKSDRAKAQRQAFAERKQANLMNSRAQALSASSGAGAGSDAPSVVKIMSDIAGQGELNAQTAMWNGEEDARGLEFGAKMARKTGNASMLGSLLGAGSSLAAGFSKYR